MGTNRFNHGDIFTGIPCGPIAQWSEYSHAKGSGFESWSCHVLFHPPCHFDRCKGFVDLKSSYLYENLPVQTKMAILSWRPIPLAILLYKQFIHLTWVNLSAIIQFLSTQQRAYQSGLVTSWVDSVFRHCVMLDEFTRKNIQSEYELQLFDYNV